jgi:hypothetical protein
MGLQPTEISIAVVFPQFKTYRSHSLIDASWMKAIVGGRLGVTGGDAPTLFELVEAHQIAGAIKVAAKANWLPPVSFRRHVGARAVAACRSRVAAC